MSAASETTLSPRPSRGWIWPLGLSLLAAAAYAPIVTHGFVTYDDPAYVTENSVVKQGLTWSGIGWAFSTGHISNWHPLTWLSHMVDVELFGLWAGGHHLGNLLLHAANTALVFVSLRRLVEVGWRRVEPSDSERRRLRWRAAAVAALFAVHPLHVESVAWVAERKDTLSSLFWLLAMLAYANYVAVPSPRRYATVAGCLALGLLSKPMLVTLPCVLILLDYWPLYRLSAPRDADPAGPNDSKLARIRRLLVEKAPLFLLVAASSLVTLWVQNQGGALKSTGSYPWNRRAWNAVFSYARYLVAMIAPGERSFFYRYPAADFLDRGLREPLLAASAALLAGLTALGLVLARRAPYLLVGWLWYLGTLTPVIGLVQVGDQALADRYTYIPLLGIFIVLAWGLPDLVDLVFRSDAAARRGERILASLATVAVAASLVLTWRQQAIWRDSATFYRHGIALDPANYVAHNNLALVLCDDGKHQEAHDHYVEALRAHPRYVTGHFNMGTEMEHLKRWEDAERYYRRALALSAAHSKSRHNLAALLARQGRLAEAETHARQAAKEMPDAAMPRRTLGLILLRLDRPADALSAFERAVELAPEMAETQAGLGIALARLGRRDEARRALDRAQALKPGYPEPAMGLGDLAAANQSWEEAARHYRQAARYEPNIGEAHRKLAEIAWRQGRADEAAREYRAALESDPYDPAAAEGYARVLEALGRAEEAERQRAAASELRRRCAVTGSEATVSER